MCIRDRPTRVLRSFEAPDSVIRLVHHGYAAAAVRERKARRNAALLESHVTHTALRQLPEAVRAKRLSDWCRSLTGEGRLREAAAAIGRARKVGTSDVEARRAVALSHFGLLAECGDHEGAGRIVEELRDLGADADLLAWLSAELLCAQGNPAAALPLLRSLKRVFVGAGTELDGSVVVNRLMIAAVDDGEFDEALACCIELITSTGDVERFGPRLLRLWGSQPLDCLAQLLVDFAAMTSPAELAAAFRAQGPWGQRVAAAIERVPGALDAATPLRSPLSWERLAWSPGCS